MNSKIVITGKNKAINDKFSQISSKRSSKSKFEDIELGSTIGEIYRKSRSKSAVSHRKRHGDTKTIYKSMINTKPVKTKQYYKNDKPAFQENKVIKLNKNSPVVIDKSPPEKLVKSPPEKLVKSPPKKLVKSPPKKLVKSSPKKLVKSPPKKLVKSPPKNSMINKKVTIKSKKISSQVKKPDYKTVKVKTNVNSYLIPDNIVSKNILDSKFNNNHHFTQFTDTADRYLVKVISGGIDINKYKK
tara:strand:+ start:2507 stop:3235 length:729 start_codon:yes stop_codon:yes gene_type:complete